MRQVIDGLLYDTETAKLVFQATTYSHGTWAREKNLYVTDSGNWFIQHDISRDTSGIEPIDPDDAFGLLQSRAKDDNEPMKLLFEYFPERITLA